MAPQVLAAKEKNYELKKLKNYLGTIKKLIQIRKYIEKNFEFVGNNFTKKVREVYYDKKSKKTIYGTTTSKERAELSEEGIELLSIPWIDKDN